MASAFALTLAYLGEQCSSMDAGGAFAAYITGNVASNLIGRLVSAAVVDTFGLASNFYFFALLNLAGAVLVYFTIQRVKPMHAMPAAQSPFAAMIAHWRDPSLRAEHRLFCHITQTWRGRPLVDRMAHQVLHNRESSALQYAMRDRLWTLGWSEIEVIDDNLGSRLN